MGRLNPILFADDTTLHFSHDNIYSLCNTLTTDLSHVKNWLLANKLTLNARKTYFMIFTLKHVPNDIRVAIGNHALDRQYKGKFLGLMLDDRLNFSDHIAMISNKIAKVTGIFYRIKDHFPDYIMKQLYYSLVAPHFTYCIIAWGCCSGQVLQPLILIQMKLVRILSSSEYLAHTSPLFKSLSLLKINDIYKLSLMNLMFQTLTLNKHPLIRQNIIAVQPNHRYRTRNVNLLPPFTRVQKCEQSYLYQGIKLWNSLPAYLKALLSIHSFKKSYKNYLLSDY